MKLTSIILAGGKNVRLGRNKALERIGGNSLIERIIERLGPLSDQILIVTAAGQPGLPVDGQAEILTDIYPDMGPLGGVYTGLCASRNTANITVACDMPFLNPGLLTWMAGLLDEHCAVVPRLDNGMIEPLHAVYSRKCVGTMEERLLKGQLGIYAFLKSVEVRYVEREESRKFDPEHLSFFNINYQSDLDRAIALTEEIER